MRMRELLATLLVTTTQVHMYMSRATRGIVFVKTLHMALVHDPGADRRVNIFCQSSNWSPSGGDERRRATPFHNFPHSAPWVPQLASRTEHTHCSVSSPYFNMSCQIYLAVPLSLNFWPKMSALDIQRFGFTYTQEHSNAHPCMSSVVKSCPTRGGGSPPPTRVAGRGGVAGVGPWSITCKVPSPASAGTFSLSSIPRASQPPDCFRLEQS